MLCSGGEVSYLAQRAGLVARWIRHSDDYISACNKLEQDMKGPPNWIGIWNQDQDERATTRGTLMHTRPGRVSCSLMFTRLRHIFLCASLRHRYLQHTRVVVWPCAILRCGNGLAPDNTQNQYSSDTHTQGSRGEMPSAAPPRT